MEQQKAPEAGKFSCNEVFMQTSVLLLAAPAVETPPSAPTPAAATTASTTPEADEPRVPTIHSRIY